MSFLTNNVKDPPFADARSRSGFSSNISIADAHALTLWPCHVGVARGNRSHGLTLTPALVALTFDTSAPDRKSYEHSELIEQEKGESILCMQTSLQTGE